MLTRRNIARLLVLPATVVAAIATGCDQVSGNGVDKEAPLPSARPSSSLDGPKECRVENPGVETGRSAAQGGLQQHPRPVPPPNGKGIVLTQGPDSSDRYRNFFERQQNGRPYSNAETAARDSNVQAWIALAPSGNQLDELNGPFVVAGTGKYEDERGQGTTGPVDVRIFAKNSSGVTRELPTCLQTGTALRSLEREETFWYTNAFAECSQVARGDTITQIAVFQDGTRVESSGQMIGQHNNRPDCGTLVMKNKLGMT